MKRSITAPVLGVIAGIFAGIASAALFDFQSAMAPSFNNISIVHLLANSVMPGVFFGLAACAQYSFFAWRKGTRAIADIFIIIISSIGSYTVAYWLAWYGTLFFLVIPFGGYFASAVAGFLATFMLASILASTLDNNISTQQNFITAAVGAMLALPLINEIIYPHGMFLFFILWQGVMAAVFSIYFIKTSSQPVLLLNPPSSVIEQPVYVATITSWTGKVVGAIFLLLLVASAVGLHFFKLSDLGKLSGVQNSITTETSDQDTFIRMVANDFNVPSLCEKISESAVEESWGKIVPFQDNKQTDFTKSLCYADIAVSMQNPLLCDNIRPVIVDSTEKEYMTKEECVKEASVTQPRSEPPHSGTIGMSPTYDKFMIAMGYTEAEIPKFRKYLAYSTGWTDLYYSISFGELYTDAGKVIPESENEARRKDFISRVLHLVAPNEDSSTYQQAVTTKQLTEADVRNGNDSYICGQVPFKNGAFEGSEQQIDAGELWCGYYEAYFNGPIVFNDFDGDGVNEAVVPVRITTRVTSGTERVGTTTGIEIFVFQKLRTATVIDHVPGSKIVSVHGDTLTTDAGPWNQPLSYRFLDSRFTQMQ